MFSEKLKNRYLERHKALTKHTLGALGLPEGTLGQKPSAALRVGKFLLGAAVGLELALPALLCSAVIVGAGVRSVAAQTPGGSVFGGNDQTAGRGIVEFIKWFRVLIYLAGVASFLWAGFNMMADKPWGVKAIAGIACFAMPSLINLGYSFSQGNAVQFNSDLGN